jgi:hypothetical protein
MPSLDIGDIAVIGRKVAEADMDLLISRPDRL